MDISSFERNLTMLEYAILWPLFGARCKQDFFIKKGFGAPKFYNIIIIYLSDIILSRKTVAIYKFG